MYLCTFLFGVLSTCVLVSGQCQQGWLNHDENCYFFSRDILSWPEAMEMCIVQGGYLAEIESEREGHFIETEIKILGHNFWLGASDTIVEGEWIWETSKIELSRTHYSKWGAHQPDNYAFANCLAIHLVENWVDEQCNLGKNFICKLGYNQTAPSGGEVVVG